MAVNLYIIWHDSTYKTELLQVVRDSSAVRRHYFFLQWDVGELCMRKAADLPSNSWSAHFHVSWLLDFVFYHKPYMDRFTSHFSVHSWPSCPRRVVLHSITARFSLRPYDFVISHPFWNICHATSRKLQLPQCIMGDDLHINKQIFVLSIIGTC